MPAIVQEVVSLVGELTAFKAVSSDGWGHGLIAVGAERHKITGKLFGVSPGQTIEVQGTWVDTEKFGRQFKVRQCTSTQPQSADGIVAWMCSTLPDIGVGRARALVQRFGDQLWQVIENDHRRLTEVSGITPVRAEAIRVAYRANRADRDNMILLRGWGLTDSQIGRCVERWETLHEVVEAIRENPYQLSQHVYGFGFVRADTVAMKAGVKYDSPQRIAAAIEHLVEESVANEGHVFLPFGELRARASKLIGVPPDPVTEVLRSVLRSGRLVRRGARVYSRRLDEAERTCADAIAALLRAS